MTAPDTKAIRAQMEALEGFTPGPWSWDEECPDGYSEWYLRPGVLIVDGSDGTPDGDEIDRANAQIIAAAPDMHATIFALCDEVERLSPAPDAMARLAEAITPAPQPEGDPVTLTYTNWRGETAQRTITPKRIWWGATDWHPEPQWLLTAFDAEKQADRDFALKDFGAATPQAAQEAVPVAWGESYDGGAFFHTVSLTKTKHHTYPLYAHPPQPSVSVAAAAKLADAIEACDWSGSPIGNKMILRAAVKALRALKGDDANG